jgi:methyl-accepting chemotaxis protein
VGVLVAAALCGGYVVQRQINDYAFNRIEASQVSQDAQRVRIAMEYELRLLFGFAATNSVWDNTFDDITGADREAFVEDFVPGDLSELQSIDGALGVGPGGDLRVGGLVSGDGYTDPPADLVTPKTLGTLFDPAAAVGDGTCGMVATSTVPYLYCGFTVFHTDASGPAAGGLVVLKALGPQRLEALGKDLGLPLSLVAGDRAGLGSPTSMTGALGTLGDSTALLSPDPIALDIRIPTVNGATVARVHPRPSDPPGGDGHGGQDVRSGLLYRRRNGAAGGLDGPPGGAQPGPAVAAYHRGDSRLR